MGDYRKDYREFQRDYYWTLPRVVVMGVLTLSILGGAAFGLNYAGYASFNFFAPRYEAVRRETMIQSRAYSEATLREIYRLRLQYLQAKTDDEKDTIAAMAKHEADAFDHTRLPVELQAFLIQIGD